MQTPGTQTPINNANSTNAANRAETENLQQRLKEYERELLETEKVLAQETLEHARTKETLAYTRGLLDRADKSEVAIHKFLDKQEERHQHIVGKLEEKVIDANRKIATIARELGSKEERVALLSGPGRLPGAVQETPAPPPPQPVVTAPLPLDVPCIWTGLGIALTVGVWVAPEWDMVNRATATSAIWFAMAWVVLKFWSEISKVAGSAQEARAKKLKTLCKAVAVLGLLSALSCLALALIHF